MEFTRQIKSSIIAKLPSSIIPLPADVGFHSPKPIYENHSAMPHHCEYTGGVCYYDGSGLLAQDFFQTLVKQGESGVWERLENYWFSTFTESL